MTVITILFVLTRPVLRITFVVDYVHDLSLLHCCGRAASTALTCNGYVCDHVRNTGVYIP
jgi:hypothetical protein